MLQTTEIGDIKDKESTKILEGIQIKLLTKQHVNLQERYDIQPIAVDMLKRLVKDMDDNHCKTKMTLDEKMGRLKQDIAVKNSKAKQEIEFL